MEQPHVLFIVTDTTRAQTVLGEDGSDIFPTIHEFFEDGTTFTDAIANSPWTLPSHASMFSGQYTTHHKTHAGTKRFAPKTQSIAAVAREFGYQTVGFSNNPWLCEEFGFTRGFEEFFAKGEFFTRGGDLSHIGLEGEGVREQLELLAHELRFRDLPFQLANAAYMRFFHKQRDSGAERANRRVKRWFDRRMDSNRPTFMFLNYMEPHLTYNPPEFREEFLPDGVTESEINNVNQDSWAYVTGQLDMDQRDFEILRGLYRAELRYLDSQIKELLAMWRDLGLLENTAVIVVGDHGENIGDYGLMDHQYCLRETVTHVPLWIRLPDHDLPKRCDVPVELRDLYPTIAGLVGDGHSTPPVVSDIDCLAVAEDENTSRPAVSEYYLPRPSIETLRERYGSITDPDRLERSLRSIRTNDWSLIVDDSGNKELYQRPDNVSERIDMASDNSDIVDDLLTQLNNRLGSWDINRTHDSQSVSAGTKQRLEDLGYI